jgi:hypothetical protein
LVESIYIFFISDNLLCLKRFDNNLWLHY